MFIHCSNNFKDVTINVLSFFISEKRKAAASFSCSLEVCTQCSVRNEPFGSPATATAAAKEHF